MRLQESLNPVDALNEVVELVTDAEIDHCVAVPLKVAARTREYRFGRQKRDPAVREVDDRALALFEILRAVDRNGRRERIFDRTAFVLEIVPDDPMLIRGARRDDGLCFFDPTLERFALFASGRADADRRIAEQLCLAAVVVAGA